MIDAARRAKRRGIFPAIGLFFLAPLLAEFLLGNLPITMLPVLIVLAPLYGGGALLIRELVRRAGKGWPSIVLLGLAYGILEEAYTTQSLFNPNYLKLNLHLLDSAYIPALGIGAWWTVFVLTLHTAWSVSASIALAEAAVPDRADAPWLGNVGMVIAALLFAFGVIATTHFQLKQDSFRASHAQFATAGLVCVVLIAAAFMLPRPTGPDSEGWAPSSWMTGCLALAAGSAVLIIPGSWKWSAAGLVLAVDLVFFALVLWWSKRSGWGMRHKLALGGGAAMAYGWHAFVQKPVVAGNMTAIRAGNVICFLGALALIAFAARRTNAWSRSSGSSGA